MAGLCPTLKIGPLIVFFNFSIVGDFNVVVGDSNLKIDLPFGIQTHEISQVIVHENYRPDDKFHYEDIGKF